MTITTAHSGDRTTFASSARAVTAIFSRSRGSEMAIKILSGALSEALGRAELPLSEKWAKRVPI